MFHIGSGDDGNVAAHQQFVVTRNLEDSHVGEHVVLFAGHKAGFFVEDGAHVLVGREQAFHKDVTFTFADEANSLGAGFVFVGFLNQFEFVGVDTLVGANFLDGIDVTNQCGVDNTFVNSCANGANGMGVVGISSYKSFLSLGLNKFQKIV